MPIWKGHCIGRLVALIMLAIGSIAGMTVGSRAHAETTYIPAVNLSQRYDSNVFYAPKQFLQGRQQWDLVTSLAAGLKVLNKSRLGDTEVQAWGNGNVYAYNTNLSYASTNVLATSDVSDWMHELLPGAKLRLSDAFQYTPAPPAFLTGGKIDQSDVFARGVQGYRANTYSNNLSADAGYSISRSMGLRTIYTYSLRRVGNAFVIGTPFSFFNTTVHKVATGPTYTFEDGDTLFLNYNYMAADSSSTRAGSKSITFTAHSIQPEYVTTMVRGWKATINGGATLVEEAGNKTFISGKFALVNDFDRRTRVAISVSRQAAPSYFATGGALISNVAQVYLSHDLSRVMILTVSGNYGHNQTTTGQKFRFDTIYGSAALDYKLTRSTKVSLSQEYSHYSFTGSPNFDRYATMLTLTTEWN